MRLKTDALCTELIMFVKLCEKDMANMAHRMPRGVDKINLKAWRARLIELAQLASNLKEAIHAQNNSIGGGRV